MARSGSRRPSAKGPHPPAQRAVGQHGGDEQREPLGAQEPGDGPGQAGGGHGGHSGLGAPEAARGAADGAARMESSPLCTQGVRT